LAGGLVLASGIVAADDPAPAPGVVATLKGHTEGLFSVAFSPDGKLVATGSFDKTIKLWDAATGKEIKTFAGPTGHQNLVLSVAFSPDGQMLASGSTDNTAKIWDVPLSSYLQELVMPDAVNGLALSADGLKLAAAGKDGAIKIWTPADGKQLFNLTGHSGAVTDVAFNAAPAPANQLLASSGADGTVRFWNPTNGQPAGVVLAHAGPVNGVVIHPNNTAAYSAGADGLLKFWQLPIAPARALTPHTDAVTFLTLSPDGNQVITASADKTVRFSTFADGKQVRQLTGPAAAVRAVALSPTLIAGGTADQRLFLWNAADGKVVSQQVAHAGPVNGVAFHPQNNQLVTAGGDGLLKFWAMPPVPGRALTHPDAVLASTATADGKRLITGSADKIVRSWNLTNNAMERQFQGHTAPVTAVALSANGQVLASGSADQTIRFWDQTNGKEKSVVGAHAGTVTALFCNPASTQLVSASADGTVKLWGLAAAPPRIFTHLDQVTSTALSLDGAKLLTGCTDKQARLWNLTNGNMERAFPGHTLAITAVAFNADGTQVAAGGADKSLIVWNVADAKEIKKFTLPAAVQSVAFPPAGQTIAAGLADNSIRLLDLATGKEIKPLNGHQGAVNALAFLPKGEQLISGSADGTVQVWNVADGMSKAKLEYGSAVTCVALTKDAARIAVGGAGMAVKTWTLADAKAGATFATPAEVRGLSWKADGSRLAVAGADNKVRVYTVDGQLAEFFPHEGPVLSVVYHPDGRVISASADKTARVWTSALLWQVAHAGPVRQALFNAKGDQVVSASDDKTVKIWNAADGKLIRTVTAHDGPVFGVGLSADGGKIVSAGADSKAKVWDLTPPKPGTKPEDKPAAVFSLKGVPQSVAISPNGGRIAVGVAEKTTAAIVVFDAATGKELVNLAEHAAPIRSLAFLADNRTLVSTSDDKTARLADVGVLNVVEAHPGGVSAVAFHGNGTQVLSGGMDKTVKLWGLAAGKDPTVVQTFGPLADPVSAAVFNRDFTQVGAAAGKIVKVWTLDGKEVLTLTHPAPVKSLSFSVDKTKIVTGAADNLARVWDVASGKELQAFQHAGPVDAVIFHPNNTMIVSGSADKTAAIHPLSAVRVIPVTAGPVRSLAVMPSGSHVLTADDKEVKLWNTSNGAKEARVFPGGEGGVTAVAVSRNNNLVALSGPDLLVRLYNVADAKPVGQLKATGAIRRLAFSPNNLTLAAADMDKSILTWNVPFNPGQPLVPDFGKPVASFAHDAGATDVVFDLDSIKLYSGGLDKKIRKWKFASDAPTKSFQHPQHVDAVAFNPTSTLLATGCHDGIVRIWDLAKGQVLKQITAHTAPAGTQMVPAVYCVAWSLDGKQVVSGSNDHSLKLWDATAGTLVREFKGYKEKDFEKGHRDAVYCVAFSPDGKFLVSGGSDRSIKVWNVADGSVIRELVNPNLKVPTGPLSFPPQAHPGWVYSVRYTPDGKYLVSAGSAPRNQGYLALWNAADGKFLKGMELALGPIYAMALSPDGKLMALGCGPKGTGFQETNGYLLNMLEVAK
jgi:WD40 repeat protein